MGKLIVTCPKCNGKMAAPEGAERFRCPKCKTVLSAPKQAGDVAAESQTTTMTFAAPVAPSTARESLALFEEPGPASAAPTQPVQPAEGAARIREEDVLSLPEEGGNGELAAGQRLGGYTITRLIGRGGMGTVYEAMQEGLKRRVALKVMPDAAARDAEFLVNFKREAQAVAKLSHPNIVQIFDIDQDKGYHFCSMEYVDGESLARRLERQGRVPLAEAVQVVAQTAAALDFAHERMLLHRDLKPGNILLTEEGAVKLADVGLLKSLEGTSVGMVRGAHGGPLYMAPEFARNPLLADCRSDIYALGAVLFHALTGRPPFPGSSTAEIILQHAEAPFPSARAVASEVPQSVDTLLKKMCAKDPAERFQNYEELLDAMHVLLKSTDIRLPLSDTNAPTDRKRRGRKSWAPLAVGAAAAALVVVGLLAIVVPALRPARQRVVAPGTAMSFAPTKGTRRPPQKLTLPIVLEDRKRRKEKSKEIVEPPKPKTDVPIVAKQKEPPPKEQPKETPKETPKEAPKKGDVPKWQEKLAEARKQADALVAEGQFGKALVALDAAVKENEDADVAKAVADAKAAIQAQAAKAYEAVVKKVGDLARLDKFDEARAALQAVVDTYGTDGEVLKAKEAVDALDQFKEGRAALVKGAEEARAAAAAAARRATLQAEAAKAFQAVQALLSAWRLGEAAAELGKLKFDDPGLAAQAEQRKAAVEALAAYCDAIGQHLQAAEPRIRKIELSVPGMNGEITGADAEGIIAVVPGAGKQKTPWDKLTESTVERLARLKGFAKPGDAAQQLAIGFWLRLVGSEQKAVATLTRAGELGAKTDALTEAPQPPEKVEKEAQAARAFAEALDLALTGKPQGLAAALAGYKEKFGDTDYYRAHQRLLDTVAAFKPYTPPTIAQLPLEKQPEPKQKEPEPKQKRPEPKAKQPEPKQKEPEPKAKQPGDEKKAKECYEKAVAAFHARQFEECGKQLEALTAASPGSPLLGDNKLNPTVSAMQAAVKARGQALKVGPGGKGAHSSLEKALAAVDKPCATIELESGTYPRVSAAIPADKAEGLILRGIGDRRARLDGGAKRETILPFAKKSKDVWLESLEFVNTKVAIDADIDCTLSVQNCIAVTNVVSALSKHPVAKVSVADSVLRLDKLGDTPTRHSILLLSDKAAVEGGETIGSFIVGNDIGFRNVTLTDCVVIGDGVLHGGVKFNHVTAAGSLSVADDARGVAITDSILAALVFGDPRAKGKAKERKPELIVTVTNSVLYAQTRPLLRDQVKGDDVMVRSGRPPFEDPHGPDYRLPRGSPLRGKASDKTDLGCRFPREMLAILRLAGDRAAQVLRPPPPSRK